MSISNTMSDPAICDRHGCNNLVSTGMTCDPCHTWYHLNYPGLTEDQYATTKAQDLRFHCALFVHQQMVKRERVGQRYATTCTIDEDDVEHCSHTSAHNVVQTIERVLLDFASGIT